MRNGPIICISLALGFGCFAFAQQPSAKGKTDKGKQVTRTSAQPDLKDVLESKVRAAWAAFKTKDKKAYSDFLADDFIAVEADDRGTRNKGAALSELDDAALSNYLLSGFTVSPLGLEAALVTYAAFVEFPSNARVRYNKLYVSEIWVKRDGQWKARHYQATRVH